MCNDHECACYDGEAYERIAELERQIERMKPVVEAAIRWVGYDRDKSAGIAELLNLRDNTQKYQNEE